MAFRFSLETLLRYRRSLERQWELRLLQAVQEVVSINQEIAAVDAAASAVREDQAHAGTGAQLQFDLLRQSVLFQRRLELENTLIRKQNARAQCENQFRIAHREREAVEILRKEQLQDYRLEEARREQRQLDDLFLLRREYHSRR